MRAFLLLSVFTLCSSLSSHSACHAAPATALPARPNIIFILADDLGWSDTTLYGTTSFHQTPHIERLAKRGMTFTRAYSASPLCSPTRSAVLTGLSPARTGITTPNCHLPLVRLEAAPGTSAAPNQHSIQPEPTTRLDPRLPSLPQTLKAAGYATAHFGKWHLGAEPFSPLEHGFDIDLPHWPGPGPAGSFVAPWKYPNFLPKTPNEHIEDRMAAEAVAWMEKHRDQPFFINYWQFSVHAPFDAKPDLIAKHRTRIDPTSPQRSPTYAAMVESLDDAVGTLLDTLDRLQIADRTLIVFTSDNGGNMYNEIDGTTPTSNHPLRGGKATLFEGGVRVPTVIAWPGLTTPGSRSHALIQSEDFFPTFIEALALTPTPPITACDGRSLLPALRGDPLSGRAIFQYFPHAPGVPDWLPPAIAVHRDDWKLIRLFHAGENAGHRYLLFDLKNDLGENTNLATEKPDLVSELDAMIDRFLADTAAVTPKPNPAFDPSRYRPELEGVPTTKKSPPAKAKAKQTATTAGWQSSAHASVTVRNRQLTITSTGGDPWISTRAIPPDLPGPHTLLLRLKSSAKGPGTVYFSSSALPGFRKEQSLPLSITHDDQFHSYSISLPEPNPTALRLDPASAPGTIVITDLTLQSPSGKTHSLLANPPPAKKNQP
jgi:arylsulfatase A-like enzyme